MGQNDQNTEGPVRVIPLREQTEALDTWHIPESNRWHKDNFGLRWSGKRLIERVLMLLKRPGGQSIGYETGMCGSRTGVIALVTRPEADGVLRLGFVKSYRPFLRAGPECRERWDEAISDNRLAAELLGREVLELPMGFSNGNMTIEESAYLEGCEELTTNIDRASVRQFHTIHSDPFLAPEHCVIFTMMTAPGKAEYQPENLESILGSVWLTRPEITEAIRRGEICDARSLATLNIFFLLH